MLKIATHDSATGEKPRNLWSWLMIPFSRTQSKTIKQQYEAGCRLFDIRVRIDKSGLFRCAHGLFITSKFASEILNEIDNFKEQCYVLITYEGKFKRKKDEDLFLDTAKFWRTYYTNILWGPVSVKYGKSSKGLVIKYDIILDADCKMPPTEQAFLPLNGKTWQTYIPIPWLWKKIYFNTPKFNQDVYKFVDFL